MPTVLGDALRPELLKKFPPAFLGRLIVVPYYRISEAILRQIIQLQLGRIKSRIQANHKAEFAFDETVVDAIKARCTEVDSGARNVEHILMRTLLPEISNEILARLAEGNGDFQRSRLDRGGRHVHLRRVVTGRCGARPRGCRRRTRFTREPSSHRHAPDASQPSHRDRHATRN